MNYTERFSSQLLFSFLLPIVGNSKQGLRAESGSHLCPRSWNNWIHHRFRGGSFAMKAKAADLRIWLSRSPSSPPARCEQTLWNNERMTWRKCQRLWSVVLKILESFPILLVLNSKAENRVRKVCFFSYPVTCVDHWGPSGHPQAR